MKAVAAVLHWPVRRPVVTLLLVGLLGCAAAGLVRRLEPDVTLEAMTGTGQRSAAALSRVLHHYAAAEQLLLLASLPPTTKGPDPDRLLRFARRLEAALASDLQARRQVAGIRYVADPQSRQFVQNVIVPVGLFYLDEAEFEAARRRLSRDEIARQFRRNEQLISAPGPAAEALSRQIVHDPLRLHEFLLPRIAAMQPVQTFQGRDELISADGRNLLIRIAATQPPSDLDFAQAFSRTIARLAAQCNDDCLDVHLSGAHAIAAHSSRMIRRDAIISVLSAVAGLGVLFAAAFRRAVAAFVLAMIPVALGVLFGFACYCLLRRTITPLTAVIGGMLAGIGIDYSVHYLTHYHDRRRLGAAPAIAAVQTSGSIGSALLAAWATSVVGFFAIALASAQMLRDFALAAALGLTGAFACTLLVLPAALVLWDRRSSQPPPRLSIWPLVTVISPFRRTLIAAGTVLIFAPIGWLFIDHSALTLESDLTVLHPRPNPPLEAQRHIAQVMGLAAGNLIVHLQAGSDQELLTLAHQVSSRLSTPAARAAGVVGSFGLATLLPDPRLTCRRMQFSGEALAAQVLADFDAVVADSSFNPQAFTSYRSFLAQLLTANAPPTIATLDAYPQLREAILPVDRPTGTLGSPPASVEAVTHVFLENPLDRRQQRQHTLTALRALLADLPGATLTGMAAVSHDIESAIHRDLPRLLGTAAVVVVLYLLVHFRSIGQTLLALVPTCFSLACLLAAMQMGALRLNLVNMVAIPLLIGIDVDYGIFLVDLARRAGNDLSQRPAQIATSLQAIVLCAASTILGFGSICFTSVPAIQSLGVAVMIGVGGCAVGAILLLAPMLLPARSIAALLAAVMGLGLASGCAAPRGRIGFPHSPIHRTDREQWFDVSGDGRADFGISFSDGRLDQLFYDDDQDGLPDRAYRPADYANGQVPHVILLLDSIPYQTVADRYQAGDLRWFDAPQKLIAPFPTLTEICFSDLFHAPPLPGIIDRHYDPRNGEIEDGLWKRVRGRRQPWERRLHYGAAYLEHGLSFLDPRGWYAAELRRAYDAIDRSPDRVTFVYFASAASMVCKFGQQGAQEVLDGAQRLCLQLLYDRRGAIKISMMSDHGHNYTPSRNIRLERLLKAAGFRPGRRIDRDDDVVLDINGLVSCAGVHTRCPQRVAEALLGEQAIELAIYMEHDRAIVRSAAGSAAIECRSGRLRYRPIDADVLELMPLIRRLQQQGLADADGFASDEVWFRHTLDHTWPNAPRRIWDALHRLVVNPPTVLLSLRDGYCAGIAAYERYISMQSTHGGLNQANSAAFVMSMTGRLHDPLPHQYVLPRLEPGYTPRVLR